MAVGNRNTDHLDRSQPGRERARVVLGEDAEEAFDRTEQRAVDQHRTLPRTVGGRVLQLEPVRHVEVELNGRHLPAAPQCILDLYRYLRAVERRAAGVGNQM